MPRSGEGVGLYFARRFSGGVPVNNDQTRTGMERNALMEESIARAFQLAYFIHGDKETALNITAEAFAKLEVAAAAQDKRLYYKPTFLVARADRYRNKHTVPTLRPCRRS